jgi:solute carrier family 13 (sodium-dependent dicarboxylate transporter), member 2/3/5
MDIVLDRKTPVNRISASTWATFAAVLIGVSLLLSPTPEEMQVSAQRTAAVSVVMAILWIALPDNIPAVSLIPLAFYPLLGIAGVKEVCKSYADPSVFLYLGGFVIALAIERQGLHRRISLHIISRIGSQPRQIVFGFLLATALISMWISNTATTLLMLPIALALLDTLADSLAATGEATRREVDERLKPLSIAVLLGIAYAASCGGFATMVGTPTNPVLRGYWDKEFVPLGYDAISSANWMLLCVPLSLMMLAAVGFAMTWRLPVLPGIERIGRRFFHDRLEELGPMRSGERNILIVFLMTALLWVLAQPFEFGPVTIPSWPQMLMACLRQTGIDTKDIAKILLDPTATSTFDSIVAITMALVTFLLPGNRHPDGTTPRLIDWDQAERKIPWGILLLFGGGFAMADAFKVSGLSQWLGHSFASHMHGAPTWVLVFGTCALLTVMTEFTSNVATANTVLPVLGATAVALKIDPRLLLIPATISASCGFMMPVGTPPNAIVIGTGRVPVGSMMKYGLFLDLVGIVFVSLMTLWLLGPIFGVQSSGGGR